MKRLRRILSYGLFLIVVTTALLELAYRYQWVDFYANEITALSDQDSEKPNVLVFGDSFSAQRHGYLNELREQFPEYDFINSAVPGTCGVQAKHMAKSRLKKYKPELVIFQLYVGNDLLDIEHPINWETLNWKRNLYWWLADRIHVLGFFNYRMAQLSHQIAQDGLEGTDGKTTDAFSPDKYSPRTQLYIKANPGYLEQSILLKNGANETMEKLLAAYESIIEQLDDQTEFAFLIIPHCVQVGHSYKINYHEMGAIFSQNLNTEGYPFLNVIRERFGSERVLNPLPILKQKEEEGKNCYFANDPHMTTVGHKALAETILKTLPVE